MLLLLTQDVAEKDQESRCEFFVLAGSTQFLRGRLVGSPVDFLAQTGSAIASAVSGKRLGGFSRCLPMKMG